MELAFALRRQLGHVATSSVLSLQRDTSQPSVRLLPSLLPPPTSLLSSPLSRPVEVLLPRRLVVALPIDVSCNARATRHYAPFLPPTHTTQARSPHHTAINIARTTWWLFHVPASSRATEESSRAISRRGGRRRPLAHRAATSSPPWMAAGCHERHMTSVASERWAERVMISSH